VGLRYTVRPSRVILLRPRPRASPLLLSIILQYSPNSYLNSLTALSGHWPKVSLFGKCSAVPEPIQHIFTPSTTSVGIRRPYGGVQTFNGRSTLFSYHRGAAKTVGQMSRIVVGFVHWTLQNE